jgi:hypothetical protein
MQDAYAEAEQLYSKAFEIYAKSVHMRVVHSGGSL